MTEPDKKPLPTPADVVGQWAKAVVATEDAALAVLKAEMEGLSVLFGGESAARTPEEIKADEARTEAGFDNMPV
ncbi:hypothetical protein GC209_17725 [bacterium]|nr:hypothetical protein [bacterium]